MEFKDPAVKARVEQADKLTKETFGKNVYIRGIIEFSNCCRKNCNYCGIRRGNTSRPYIYQRNAGGHYQADQGIGSGMCNNTLHRRADRG